MVKGSKYILRDKTVRGYCSRCGKYYPLKELEQRKGRYFCIKHNSQVRLKRRRRKESEVARY